MRERPGDRMAFVYVGRLSYDKSVDEMLRAFDMAARRKTVRDAVLYLVGNGELLWMVKEYEQRLPGKVRSIMPRTATDHAAVQPCSLSRFKPELEQPLHLFPRRVNREAVARL